MFLGGQIIYVRSHVCCKKWLRGWGSLPVISGHIFPRPRGYTSYFLVTGIPNTRYYYHNHHHHFV